MIIYKKLNFKSFNTLNIQNIIEYFFEVENAYEIYILVYLFNLFKLDYYVLGNCSKVLFKDYNVHKPVIYINKKFSEIYYINNNNYILSSGLLLKDAIMFFKEINLGGFESLYPIPATIGGLICNNASDYKVVFSNFVSKVIVINENGKIVILSNNDCQFEYRNSLFKMQKYVILYAVVNLNQIEKINILSNIKESLIYRKLHQGSYKYSCGSLFKNDKNYKAYELIKKVKLSDLKINEIHFSNKHCNILVNDENGSCYDVILLVKLIKETIKKQLDINLKEELIIY